MRCVPGGRPLAGALLLWVLVGSCTPIQDTRQTPRIFIRSGGAVVSQYDLGEDGRILQTLTSDAQGRSVQRLYTYDSARRLVRVTRGSGAGQRDVTMENGSQRLNKKSLTGPQGPEGELTLEYYYTPDGKLDGIIQRDASGNVQAKAADR